MKQKKAQNSISPTILTIIKVLLAVIAGFVIFGIMLWRVIPKTTGFS